jgi:hypothetical protein
LENIRAIERLAATEHEDGIRERDNAITVASGDWGFDNFRAFPTSSEACARG